jgi:hypothetical protein
LEAGIPIGPPAPPPPTAIDIGEVGTVNVVPLNGAGTSG